MPTNLFVLPPDSTDPSSRLKIERPGFSAPAWGHNKAAPHALEKNQPDNFLSTLKKASNRRQRPDVSAHPRKSPVDRKALKTEAVKSRPKKPQAERAERAGTTACQENRSDFAGAEAVPANFSKTRQGSDANAAGNNSGQSAVAPTEAGNPGSAGRLSDNGLAGDKANAAERFWELTDLLNILAALGFTVSDDGQVLPPAEGDQQGNVGLQPEAVFDAVTFNRLVDSLQKVGVMPSDEAEAAWQRLQQLIGGSPAEQISLPDGTDLVQGQGADTAKPPAELQALLKDMLVQAQNQPDDAVPRTGGDSDAEKPAAKPVLETTPVNNTVKNKDDGAKTLFSQDVEPAAEPKKVKPVQSSEKAVGVRAASPVPNGESSKQHFAVADSMARNDAGPAEDNSGSRSPLQAVKMAATTVTANDTSSNTGSPSGEQTAGKISGIDGSTAETGTQSFSNQGFEKSAELLKTQESPETGRSTLRSSPMEQIVKKAVFHLKNGQTEAKIDLKPEYLGHIRMQVITEHQQVTIRIHAQLQFVKEMIENNLHQLKAELQQQGLGADKLEVSVFNDSRGQEQTQEKPEWLNFEQDANQGPAVETQREEKQPVSGHVSLLRAAGRAISIDYFV